MPLLPNQQLSRKHPDYLQRARWHDYKERCIYMITLMKNPETPVLSEIIRENASGKLKAFSRNFQAGELIDRCLQSWLHNTGSITLLNKVIMPDHVHLLLFVTETLDEPIGTHIRKFKGLCTRESNFSHPFFTHGFNDKIVYRQGQRQNFFDYIADNPRRYLARRLFPEYFRRSLKIKIGEETYSAFGNLFLLNHPHKSAVRISRSYSAYELMRRKKEWEETIRSGGGLVSPFISQAEKEIRDNAIAGGASLIIITDNGFPERYKPALSQFQLCQEGRLLLIGPADYSTRTPILTREKANQANTLAETIAQSAKL